MFFNRDSKHCKECGTVGVNRHSCPSCLYNFCKSEGHIADKCPKLTSGCPKCGEKGVNRRNCTKCVCYACDSIEHISSQCPRRKPEVRQATGPLGGVSPQATGSRKRGLQSTDLGKSMSGFELGDLSSLEKTPISTEIRDFPNLETLFRDMMRSFLSSNDNLVREYGQFLNTKSATVNLHHLFLQCIEPEIKYLEGRKVDVDLLLKIKDEQISRAERSSIRVMQGAGGYLDFLTDQRNRNYLKFYVGQSRDLLSRIHEHCLRLTRGDVSSLHYYICTLGGEKRFFNFIRLFRSPRDFCNDQIFSPMKISA